MTADTGSELTPGQILRISRGFSCLFWSMPMVSAMHALALAGLLPARWLLAGLPASFLPLACGLWMLRAAGAPTRRWRRRVERVGLAVLLAAWISPFLLWWTVAIHLLASMTMVWLAVLLYVKVGEPDTGTPRLVAPAALRGLTLLSAVTLASVLVTGTLVTGAGPHAGDKSAERPVARLQVEITTLVHAHSSLLEIYLALLVGLGFGLVAVHAPRSVLKRLGVLLVLVVAQATIGVVQFFTGVPAVLVAFHVAGAAACTAATSALWASMRQRTEPEALER